MASVDVLGKIIDERGREAWRRLPSGSKAPKGARYRVRYRTPSGASRTRTFDRRADAERFIAATEHRKASGEFVDQAAGRVTVGAYARRWAQAQPHRQSTAASVESIIATHIEPVFGGRAIASVTPSEVQAWVSGLRLAPSTVATVYGKLAAIFRAAVEDRIIARTPCTRGVRLPRAEGAEVHPMSPDEVRAMVEAVGDRYRCLLFLLAATGLRPGEALGLTVERVDFLRRTIRVEHQLATLVGEVPTLAPVKTPSSVRTIAVPESVTTAIAAHLARFGHGPLGLIFTDGKGDPIRRNALGHVWRRAAATVNEAARQAGTGPVITDRTPHDLRHYAASVLIEQGASVKAVQRHLGHKSASTTLDTYAHLFPDADEITRRALEAGISRVVSAVCHVAAS